jgi:serine/threonine protein kinase
MTTAVPCSESDKYQQLLHSPTLPGEEERLLRHLQECPACAETVERLLATDPLPAAVRGQERPPGAEEPAVQTLIERLCGLRPLAAPAGAALTLLDAPQGPDELGRLGPYRVLRLLGRGGMGVVFEGEDPALKRRVALKVLLDARYADPRHVARFRGEAEAVARLHHPNIVQIHEVGEHYDRPYLALEYLDGGNLAERLAGRPQPPRQAAELVEALARAVQHAHEQGVVHRDLKPANVLLQRSEDRGQRSEVRNGELAPSSSDLCPLTSDLWPKIADFGLAKRLDEESLTQTGDLLGTPGYMAPELASGRAGADSGPPADVYGLGAILYELLVGRPPFRGEAILDTLEQVRTLEPVPPRRLQPKVPRDLETIALKCLQKDPRQRYASALALAEDLRRFRDGVPIRARPVPPWERAWRWARRRPAAAGLIALSALAVAGLVGGLSWHTTQLNAQVRRAEAGEREARQQHELADARYQAARASLHRMLDRLKDQRLAEVPKIRELRRELLEDAEAFYQAVIEQADNPDPAIRLDAVSALVQTGTVQHQLGRPGPAGQNLQQALTLLEQLPQEYRDRDVCQEMLSLCHQYLGTEAKDAGRWEEAERHLRANLAVCERQADREQPGSWNWHDAVARAEVNLGTLDQARQRWPEAEAHYLRSIAIREKLVATYPAEKLLQLSLAQTYQNLGLIDAAQKRWSAAQALYDKALRLEEPVIDSLSEGRLSVGSVCINYASLLNGTGKSADALPLVARAVELAEAARAKEPSDVAAVDLAFNAHGVRARVQGKLGHWAEAARDWDQVVALYRRGPVPLALRLERAVALARAGEHARAAAEAESLAKEPKISGDIIYNLACVQALAAAAARSDTRLSTAERQRTVEGDAAAAVRLLERARVAGFFKERAEVENLKTDPDLEALRPRDDYRMLLARVAPGK